MEIRQRLHQYGSDLCIVAGDFNFTMSKTDRIDFVGGQMKDESIWAQKFAYWFPNLTEIYQSDATRHQATHADPNGSSVVTATSRIDRVYCNADPVILSDRHAQAMIVHDVTMCHFG